MLYPAELRARRFNDCSLTRLASSAKIPSSRSDSRCHWFLALCFRFSSNFTPRFASTSWLIVISAACWASLASFRRFRMWRSVRNAKSGHAASAVPSGWRERSFAPCSFFSASALSSTRNAVTCAAAASTFAFCSATWVSRHRRAWPSRKENAFTA